MAWAKFSNSGYTLFHKRVDYCSIEVSDLIVDERSTLLKSLDLLSKRTEHIPSRTVTLLPDREYEKYNIESKSTSGGGHFQK